MRLGSNHFHESTIGTYGYFQYLHKYAAMATAQQARTHARTHAAGEGQDLRDRYRAEMSERAE
jgi:hypothetical protein